MLLTKRQNEAATVIQLAYRRRLAVLRLAEKRQKKQEYEEELERLER